MVQIIRLQCCAERQKVHMATRTSLFDSLPSYRITRHFLRVCEFTHAFLFFIKETVKFEMCVLKDYKENHTQAHKRQCCEGDPQAATAIPKGFLGAGYSSKEDLQSLKHIIPEQFWFLTLVMGICLLDSPCNATSGRHWKGQLEKTFSRIRGLAVMILLGACPLLQNNSTLSLSTPCPLCHVVP